MSEMVERVARAMLDRLSAPEKGGYLFVSKNRDDITGVLVDGDVDFLEIARAAIAAMREPSAPMKAAASIMAGRFEEEWQAAIDAALKESEPASQT